MANLQAVGFCSSKLEEPSALLTEEYEHTHCGYTVISLRRYATPPLI